MLKPLNRNIKFLSTPYVRRRREKLQARGLCIHCGEAPPASSEHVRCQDCLDIRNLKRRFAGSIIKRQSNKRTES